MKKYCYQKDELKDDSKKQILQRKRNQRDEPEKIKSEKTNTDNNLIKEKRDYTKLSLEKLVNVFEELSTGDFWLKNQQNLQLN